MIIIKYEEERVDHSTGDYTYTALGEEAHKDIEEILLPDTPRTSPIFFTKKFVGQPEYRWEVRSVEQNQNTTPLTYTVTLIRRRQVEKEFYLKNILATRRYTVRRVIYPWSLVEVEFGHAPTVRKLNCDTRSNKRYADTVQVHSMPKRRLAVVIQVIERNNEDLLQVVPITSQQPHSSDKAAVEITSALSKMVNYQKQSWAICRMIQTVTASRVIAPLVDRSPGPPVRDKSFRTQVRDTVREALKDALMFGVAADNRVQDTANLAIEKQLNEQLKLNTESLTRQIAELEKKLGLYEKLAEYNELTHADVLEMFQNQPS